MASGVYRIHCVANDTFYIGEARSISTRWRKHIQGLQAGTHDNRRLQAMWKKYGQAAFKFEVVWEVSAEVLIAVDRKRISEITRTMEAAIGSSMLSEGFTLANIAPFEHWSRANPSSNPEVNKAQSASAKKSWTPERRARASVKQKQVWSTPEAKSSRSKTQKEAQNTPSARSKRSTNTTRQWKDPEFIALMSRRMSGGNSPVARRVLCVETGQIFETISAASRSIRKRASAVATALWAGKRCGGYSWKYV